MILLDTHALIWLDTADRRLGRNPEWDAPQSRDAHRRGMIRNLRLSLYPLPVTLIVRRSRPLDPKEHCLDAKARSQTIPY